MTLPFKVIHSDNSGQTFVRFTCGERNGQTKVVSPPLIGDAVWALWQEYQAELDHSHKLETDLDALTTPDEEKEAQHREQAG